MKTKLILFSMIWLAIGLREHGFSQNSFFYSGAPDSPRQYDISAASDGSILLDVYNDALTIKFDFHFLNLTQLNPFDYVSFGIDNTGSGTWGSSYARGSTYFQGVSWTNGIVNYASDCLRLSEGGTDSHFGGSSTHQSHIDINITFIIDSQNPRRMTPPKGLYISGRAFNINFQYPSSSTFCAPSTWPQLVLSGSGPGPVVYYSHTAFDLGGDARGDADGRPESGERIELAVTLINQGNATAEGVVGILSTSDPDVTIQDYFNTWADIPGGATQDNLGNFVFDIKSNLAQDKTVTFTLTVSANGTGEMISTFEVPIYVQNQVQINAPGNLAATVQNNNTVQLTWQDNSDNEEGFKIERQIGSGNWNEIATTGANIKSYTDTGLTGGQAYSYRVRTYLLLANSDYSNEASVTLPLVIFTEISTSLPGTDFSAATWGDYDNDDDLDILLAGRGDSGSIAKVYRNDGGAFTDIAAPLAVVSDGADRWMEWGDYDNDGDLDILLTGSGLQGPTSKIYRNDNGNFVDLNAGLTGVYHSSVAWGDYDNDGDLDVLLTGWDGGDRIAKIYRNDAGKFLNISAPLTPVDFSSVAWGDYDNDGDLDILLTGTPDGASGLTKIYRNDHGNFVDIAAPLVGVSGSSVAWGDYDNDGDLDILLSGGTSGNNSVSKVYRNNGSNFVDIAAPLTNVLFSTVAWGDYDNDGDLDILLAGSQSPGPTFKVYRNDNGQFAEIFDLPTGILPYAAAWGDYDNDGDLDIVLTGSQNSVRVTKLYRNNTGTANTVPNAPTSLAASITTSSVTLSWNKSTDGQTARNALTYNLRVGKTPGGSEVVSPMSEVSSGFRRVSQLGNTNHNTNWTIKNLSPGKYYWSVQAIDNTFAGSPFAPEQSFVINPTVLKPEVQPAQSIGTEFWVEVAINDVQNLFGISFELNYTNTQYVDIVTPTSTSVIPGAFLGNDIVFVANVDEANGKVNIGVSRKTGQAGISGSGVIARVKFNSSATTPAGTQVTFLLSNVTANDPSGSVIMPQLANATVTLSLSGVMVWPGDTNNDKLVNQSDVLPIGLHWNKTGPARQNPSSSWSAQLATAWTPAAATYADGNGDGIVNQSDILPIGLNWGKTHTAPPAIIAKSHSPTTLVKSSAAAIRTSITGDTNPGQDFVVDVVIDQVAGLFGVSFELLYSSTTLVEPQSANAGSLLGNDVVFFPNIDESAGKVSLGITRKSGQSGVNGSGTVAQIKMRVSSQAVHGQAFTLILQSVAANDSAGQPIQLTVSNSQNVVVSVESRQNESLPATFALHPNTPNPFNPSTAIQYDLPKASEVTIKIFDMLGKHVRTLVSQHQSAGRHSIVWDGRDEKGQVVASGVFIYQLRVEKFVQSRKMVLMR